MIYRVLLKDITLGLLGAIIVFFSIVGISFTITKNRLVIESYKTGYEQGRMDVERNWLHNHGILYNVELDSIQSRSINDFSNYIKTGKH